MLSRVNKCLVSSLGPQLSDRVDIDGKYIVLKRLGEGGFGTVYLCKDPDLGRDIAIKVIRRQENNDSQAKRFLNEAKALAKCKHPGVVKLIKFGVTSDGAELYFVMDPLDGRSLANEIDTIGPLAPRRLLSLFAQVFDALEHAHQNGIVHRDLKPSNIMLSSREGQEQAVLIDFGLMRAPDNEVKITATGDMLGTPLYMSPEQCQGVVADHRSDVYSAGCCVYAAATGRPPFEGDGYSVMMDHLKTSPSAIPEYLHEFISKCMDKDPENRFQSARSAREVLLTLEQMSVLDIDVPMSAEPAVKSVLSVRSLLLPVAASLMMIGLVVVLSFMIRPPSEDGRPEPAPVVASQALTAEEIEQEQSEFTEQIKRESEHEKKKLRIETGRTKTKLNRGIDSCNRLIERVRKQQGQSHLAVFYPILAKAEIIGKYSNSQRQVESALIDIAGLQTIPACLKGEMGKLAKEAENRLSVRMALLEAKVAMEAQDSVTAGKKLEQAHDLDDGHLKVEVARAFVSYSYLLGEQGDDIHRKAALKRAIELFESPKAISDQSREAIDLFTMFDLSNDADFVNKLALHLQKVPSFDMESEIRSAIQAGKLFRKINRTEQYHTAILRGIRLALQYEKSPKLRAFDAIHLLVSVEPSGPDEYLKLAQRTYEDLKPYRDSHTRQFAQAAIDLAKMEVSRHQVNDAMAHYREAREAADNGMRNPANAQEAAHCQVLSVQTMIAVYKLAPEAERAAHRQQVVDAIANVDAPAYKAALTKEFETN